jgi:hypothetical protein
MKVVLFTVPLSSPLVIALYNIYCCVGSKYSWQECNILFKLDFEKWNVSVFRNAWEKMYSVCQQMKLLAVQDSLIMKLK